MKTKHTPGPWRSNLQKGGFGFVMATHPDGGGTHVAGRIKNSANARLIAAAPEMLEALESVQIILGVPQSEVTRNSIMEIVKTAIRKAKGDV